MTNRDDDEEKKNVRLMWIATGAIVLFIIGLNGSQHARRDRPSK